jgi:hypothetical protein
LQLISPTGKWVELPVKAKKSQSNEITTWWLLVFNAVVIAWLKCKKLRRRGWGAKTKLPGTSYGSLLQPYGHF